MSIGLGVYRAQIDLCRRNVGMSEFLAQSFDVNAVLVPPRRIQHTTFVMPVALVAFASLSSGLLGVKRPDWQMWDISS